MAIPAAIIAVRRSGAGLTIADVRLIDGSKDTRGNAAEHANAALPITLFFPNESALTSFKEHIGRSPFLFMCLSGNISTDASVKITTLKDMSWWELASGTRSDGMG